MCYNMSMAGKDLAEKTLLSYNDVFADIVNAIIFDGDDVVKEKDLSDAQTDSMYLFAHIVLTRGLSPLLQQKFLVSEQV